VNLFWVEARTGFTASYERLVGDVAKAEVVAGPEGYRFAVQLLRAICRGESIDLGIAGLEEEGTGLQDRQEKEDAKLQKSGILELVEAVRKSKGRVRIWTSGTSGESKRVEHTVQNLIAHVRATQSTKPARWAFTFPLDRFAGLQVFFQALLNGDTLVNLIGRSPTEVVEAIDRHEITHLSGTPTFYRLISSPNQNPFPKVTQVTCGGETLDADTLGRICQAFPNARVRNIYASTEAGSLLVSPGTEFQVPQRLEGKIRVADGRLLIHRSLLADDPPSDQADESAEFYDTGDTVRVVTEQPLTFAFEARSSARIVVGGRNVDPLKVESIVNSIAGVIDAVCYGHANSVTGQVVACDVVVEPGSGLTGEQIRVKVREQLESYETPMVVRLVERLEVNRTGKKVRGRRGTGLQD